jgi:hypothetical protein
VKVAVGVGVGVTVGCGVLVGVGSETRPYEVRVGNGVYVAEGSAVGTTVEVAFAPQAASRIVMIPR